MKIQVKNIGSRAYYDEVLFMAYRYKKIKKNPNVKTKNLGKSFKLLLLFIILYGLLLLLYFIKYNDSSMLLLHGIYIGLGIFYLILVINYNMRIKMFMNNKREKFIEIDEKNITYSDGYKKIELNWDNVHMIIINKYSICFFPKTSLSPMISISLEYKESVLNAVNEYKKSNLIIDNSYLYSKK